MKNIEKKIFFCKTFGEKKIDFNLKKKYCKIICKQIEI